jgi:hypothetical protein
VRRMCKGRSRLRQRCGEGGDLSLCCERGYHEGTYVRIPNNQEKANGTENLGLAGAL